MANNKRNIVYDDNNIACNTSQKCVYYNHQNDLNFVKLVQICNIPLLLHIAYCKR